MSDLWTFPHYSVIGVYARVAASISLAFYCNSNCTGIMERGTRLLSTGWSPDYSSRIQSELNACPQFILRVMLSAAPVYGYVWWKTCLSTWERFHFSPYCRKKGLRLSAARTGEGLFREEYAMHLNGSCRLFDNLADLLLVQHLVAQYLTISGPQIHLISFCTCLINR